MAKAENQKSMHGAGIPFAPGVEFARKAVLWWLPLLYLLISDSFYLRTYDSAQVKITLVQMGGVALMGLWGCLLSLEGKKAFRRDDFIFLAPFVAYLAYIIVSFLHAPYKGPSVDDLVRYIFYMTAALIVIREFDESGVNRLTKILIITAWITIGYGFIQWLDTRFFPPKGSTPNSVGIDPFIWRWAFSHRVFSTFGNPNFFGDFLVLIFPVLVSQYLKTRSVLLIPLMGLNLLNLYATETKGAWLGFGAVVLIFLLIYTPNFMRERFEAVKWKVWGFGAAVFLATLAMVLYFLSLRITSASFRVATWLSTWEMIESQPLAGIGVGSFKVIYPAYRRPKIFHIEGKHNTETDHAEDEFLEQWMDNGALGFGIFLWLIIFTTITGLRSIKELTSGLANKGARPPPRAYDLLGYLTAFLGMLFHNFFDVSMRFVSSGVYLGLLSGLVINLARGHALWELHYKEAAPEPQAAVKAAGGNFMGYMRWLMQAAAVAGLVYLGWLIFSQFAELQGPLSRVMQGGERLQWWISWSVMLAVVLGLGYAFAKIVVIGNFLIPPLIVLLMLLPVNYFWGFFKADVYHNMAIFFSKQAKWDDALTYYRKVNSHNPYFIMPYYFTGNVFNDRFNMEKQYRPEWGDADNVPRDDFERAMEAYEKVRKIAPNYVQMHHQAGLLYMKMADYMNRHGKPKEAAVFWDKALGRFNLYHNLDPVFPQNYYRRAQVYMARKELDKAEKEYLDNINAAKCHEKGHNHGSPEAYTNLANFYHLSGRFPQAESAYRKALEMDTGYVPAKRNLDMLYQRYKASAEPVRH
ncbi:MAG: O-antigen ligase family protein [bacterium]